MRAGALLGLFWGLTVLGVAAGVRVFEDVLPFSASYSPRGHVLEATYFFAMVYVIATYGFAAGASLGKLTAACVAQISLLVVALAVFVAYRWHYAFGEPPRIFVFDHYERVTPFHEQLAVPAFIALAAAPLILYAAVRSERRAVVAHAG